MILSFKETREFYLSGNLSFGLNSLCGYIIPVICHMLCYMLLFLPLEVSMLGIPAFVITVLLTD